MNRRGLIGVAILAVALVAALGGNARTKTLDGVAVVGPIPGPPALGACVIRPVSTTTSYDPDSGIITYPVPAIGGCARHFGEVTAILAGALGYLLDLDQPYSDPHEPAARCSAETDSYLGRTPDRSAETGGWQQTLNFTVVPGAPTASEQAMGQDWVACIAVPGGGYDTYDRTMRDVVRTGAYPPQLATCTDVMASSHSRSTVDCRTPHNSEQFAVLFTADPDPERAGRETECSGLVRAMTGMSDPTAGGRLRIDVDSERLDAPPDSASGAGDQQLLTCQAVAVGSAHLVGPLLGLGDLPIPMR